MERIKKNVLDIIEVNNLEKIRNKQGKKMIISV